MKNAKRVIRWDRVMGAALIASILLNGLFYALTGPSQSDLDGCVAADRQIKAEMISKGGAR